MSELGMETQENVETYGDICLAFIQERAAGAAGTRSGLSRPRSRGASSSVGI